jgi:hypothetical protein
MGMAIDTMNNKDGSAGGERPKSWNEKQGNDNSKIGIWNKN